MHISALYRYPVKSLGGQSFDALALKERGFEDDRRWMFVEPSNGLFISCRAVPKMLQIRAEVHQDDLHFIRIADGETVAVIEDARRQNGSSAILVKRKRVTVWDDSLSAKQVEDACLPTLTETLGIPGAQLVYMDEAAQRPVDPRYAKPSEEVSFADGYPYLVVNEASNRDLAKRMNLDHLDIRRFRPNIVVDGAAAWAEDDWQSLSIGEATFRLPKPCARCIMVSRAPETGERSQNVLGALAEFRKQGNKVLFGMNALCDTPELVLQVGEAVR